MKYELIRKSISQEHQLMIDVLDENQNVIGQEPDTEHYKVIITLVIKPTDEIAPEFSKDIEIVSSNALTGFQVDDQREQAIDDFMLSIND